VTLVLRIGRSKSIWEDGTVEELLRYAFSRKTGEPDLKLSVYVVGESQATQAVAEHLVSETLPNFSVASPDLNLSDLATPIQSPGTTSFKFTRDEAHAEFHLASEEQLKEIIRRVKEEASRRLARDRERLWGYVIKCHKDGDPEWTEVLARPDKVKWREYLARKK